jgi:hypothetical protein
MASGIRGGNLYIGEDNIVYWGDPKIPGSGLYDNNLGSFVNNASMSFTLKNSAGSAVSGASSISMTYISGTEGCYYGILEDGVSLTDGSTYYLEITATGSSDRVGFRRIEYKARYHGAD